MNKILVTNFLVPTINIDMNNNPIENSKNTVKLPIILSIAIAGGMFVGATLFGGSNAHNGNLGKGLNKYKEVLTWIDNSYVDSVETDSLVDFSIQKMLEKLDPHTQFYPPKEATQARAQLEAGFDGIGVEFNIFHDSLFVISPLVGGPSEAVGIQAGDVILKANDTRLVGSKLTSNTVFSSLRGPRGSEVKLDIFRKGIKNMLSFTIKRDRIPSYSIDAGYMIDDRTGYIKVTRFSESTYEEFKTVLASLKQQNMKQLVLDLRGNPGGYKDRAEKMVDELIGGEKLIVSTDGKRPEYDSKTYTKFDGQFEKGAIIVLVDEGSASASEIVAGALQDNDRALIVGRRTFGKGLVQMPIRLTDGSELRLTISRYFTPSGRSIQKPYTLGHSEEYGKDFEHRVKAGEMFNQDSIKINKKLMYKTNAGRTVYGGGGIMPDVFIAKDTSLMSSYLYQLFARNIIREYTFKYVVDNKDKLEKQDIKTFNKTFQVTDKMLEGLTAMATVAGVKMKDTEYNRSKPYIKAQTKAYIARQLWKKQATDGLNNEYYIVMSSIDETLQKALKLFDKAAIIAK
jgi:carboxyl-terminal processing protease